MTAQLTPETLYPRLSPSVEQGVAGIISDMESAERRRRRASTSRVGCSDSARYDGAVLCRRTSRVLGEEIRPHHAVTPRTTLAEGRAYRSREDSAPARRAGLSVSIRVTA